MIGDNLYAYAGGFSDILLDRFDLPIALRTPSQSDIIVFHSYGFEDNAMFVAVVFHPLHFIQIPGTVPGLLSYLRGEMPYAVAQIVFQVCLRRHVGPTTPRDAMIVSPHVHQRILLRDARGPSRSAQVCNAAANLLAQLSSLHNATLRYWFKPEFPRSPALLMILALEDFWQPESKPHGRIVELADQLLLF